MASSAAMAAARSMPAAYTVPLGPRVRPPRLLPGTKADNTDPQPEGPVPERKAWVQGKWRELQSNAAEDRRNLQSIQVEKALRHSTHGMNIYAYRQIRTNQVVYSLSRVMQNNKILSQLIYHGKQTKPAALRRDVWRPYFSIHFPQTEAGAATGLDTFQLLRELSARRQLSPPQNALLATKEDVEKAEGRYDPATLARFKENKSADLSTLPKLGQLLPPKYRATKLMDQKASSVADVAFALAQINDAKLSPHDRLQRMQARLKSKHLDRSRRNRRRINEIRLKETTKDMQIQDRQTLIDAPDGQLTLNKYAAERIALEHDGFLAAKDRVKGIANHSLSSRVSSETSAATDQFGTKPSEFDIEKFTAEYTTQWNAKHEHQQTKPPFPSHELDNLIQQKIAERKAEIEQWQERAQDRAVTSNDSDGQASRNVLVLWSDLKDAMHAKSWTNNVQHDWVDAKAVVKKQRSVVRQSAYVDEDGHEIQEQKQTRLFQTASSPHVMGRDVSDNWMTDHDQLTKEADTKVHEWNTIGRENIVRTMIDRRQKLSGLAKEIFELDENLDKENLTKGWKKPRDFIEGELVKAKEKSALLDATYPTYARVLDQLQYFSELIIRNHELVKQVKALKPGDHARGKLMEEEHATAKEIRSECDIPFPGFSQAVRKHQETLVAVRPKMQVGQSQTEQDINAVEESQARLNRQSIEESRAELEIRTVEIVLEYHQKQLQELGDEYGDEIAHTSSKTRDQPSLDLKDLDIEVDTQRSMWSRVKSVFGR